MVSSAAWGTWAASTPASSPRAASPSTSPIRPWATTRPTRPGPTTSPSSPAPTTTHADVARPLLDAGLPCLIEKPLAPSAALAAELAAAPNISVGHVERFNPTLQPLLDTPGFAPRFLSVERLAPFQRRGTDVDVIADLMIHDLDLALWLLGGEAALTDVRAIGVGVMTGGADIVDARLEFDGGRTVATLSGLPGLSAACPHPPPRRGGLLLERRPARAHPAPRPLG